jgi:DNA repair exonuclease SbcCD nuclease subunit
VATALVSSDWHLGKGDRADQSNPDGVRAVVYQAIEFDVDMFVVAGDFSESHEQSIESLLRHNGDLLTEAFGALTDAGIPIHIVRGNHDPNIRKLCEKLWKELKIAGVVGSTAVEFGPWRIEHGNRFDPWNAGRSPLLPVAYVLTAATGGLERIIPGFDIRKFHPEKLLRVDGPDMALRHPVHAVANRWALKHQTSLCYGHSHRAYKLTVDDVTVCNTGCVLGQKCDYVLLSEDGSASVHSISREEQLDG